MKLHCSNDAHSPKDQEGDKDLYKGRQVHYFNSPNQFVYLDGQMQGINSLPYFPIGKRVTWTS